MALCHGPLPSLPSCSFPEEFEKRLQTNAGELLDCRNADAPTLEIELWEGKAKMLRVETLGAC